MRTRTARSFISRSLAVGAVASLAFACKPAGQPDPAPEPGTQTSTSPSARPAPPAPAAPPTPSSQPAAPATSACEAVPRQPGGTPISTFKTKGIEVGIDVSHYDGQVDWPKVAASGVSFVYIKASEGGGFVDPCFESNRNGAIQAGLKWGAYHVLTAEPSPASQTNHFLSVIGAYRGGLPPAVDVEGNRISETEIQGLEVAKMLADIHARTKRKPTLYTGHRGLAKLRADAPGLADHSIWLAEYADSPAPLPEGIDSWWMWQRSPDVNVPGINSLVDVNHHPAQPQ